jgi:hypothetical protein
VIPMRPAGTAKRGDHVEIGGVWLLVHTIGRYSGGIVSLEITHGLNSTRMVEYAASHDLPLLKPGEWVAHVIAQHRERAAGVSSWLVGPVERAAGGVGPPP